jgi:hypothetical protein
LSHDFLPVEVRRALGEEVVESYSGVWG